MHTSPPGPLILLAVLAAYQAFEVALVARRGWKESRAAFFDLEVLGIGALLLIAALLAAAVAWFVTPLAIPGNGWGALVVGVLVMCAGVAIRLWAVIALGRFFRPVVVLQSDHRVITEGPYRLVRHPSYTGILLAQAGFGIALGNFLSIAICVAIPLLLLQSRIAHEEEALDSGLGDEYRAYAARTSRLVPGIW
jgi:protein-S-isoprenylcysteine O-methyltransferase Ste14